MPAPLVSCDTFHIGHSLLATISAPHQGVGRLFSFTWVEAARRRTTRGLAAAWATIDASSAMARNDQPWPQTRWNAIVLPSVTTWGGADRRDLCVRCLKTPREALGPGTIEQHCSRAPSNAFFGCRVVQILPCLKLCKIYTGKSNTNVLEKMYFHFKNRTMLTSHK
eukprot:SAG11_NODE_4308_length_1952_cov_5.091105_1_plen_166_part_00